MVVMLSFNLVSTYLPRTIRMQCRMLNWYVPCNLDRKLRSDVRYASVVRSCGQTVAATVVFLSVSSRYDKMNELQTPKLSDSMQIHYKPQPVCVPAAETTIMCVSE